MEIVDAQVHLNQLVPDWKTSDADRVIAAGIAAMDAVGIDALLIAESRGFDAQMRPALGPVLPNGAVRGEFPFSERAVATHPDRFGYLVRIDPRDPELERLMAEVRQKPGALCIRIVPVPNIGEVDAFERGVFEPLLAAAAEHAVPVFAWFPGRSHLLVPYLRKYPTLHIILDHCGVGVAPPLVGQLPPTLQTSLAPTLAERVQQLERVIDLAQYPNLALKWCHAPGYLSAEPYPHRDMLPLLRKVIDAFGIERVMWASDYTQSRNETGYSWAHTLHYLRDSDQLSDTEKDWLLGRSVRQILRWPAATREEVPA
ncbi:MAG TPA: amidohydrolase family protein [Chloroflexota bacterium]